MSEDENLAAQVAEIREVALDDAKRTAEHDLDLNPYSTQGGRALWQGGWDGVRPANLVDGSINWRYWERGRQAKIVAQECGNQVELERPRQRG